MEKGSLRSKKGRNWSILDRAPTPRRGNSRLGVQSISSGPKHALLWAKPATPRRGHQHLGVAHEPPRTAEPCPSLQPHPEAHAQAPEKKSRRGRSYLKEAEPSHHPESHA
ncbi:hypothetical protein PIB30_092670 [Stylosanthes scabra]|uniref:Uncharacterized protein n=1 Tax=Stylosanthes scabra TaxID=79078 RepID=A0ABU6XUR1_9FABA|nr:hypothetical protein [Stylosanthes scabra]